MTHDPHAAPISPDDLPPLPTTTGVAFGMKLLIFGGLFLAAMQGFFVTGASSFGRVWPAADSAKIPLPPANLPPQ
jgi:hypothetical protein